MHAFSSILCFFQKMSATLSLFNFIQATPPLPWCEKRSGQRLWSHGAPYSATGCLSLGLCRISSDTRTARAVAKNYPHHVTQTGNYQQPVFEDENDYRQYLFWLKDCSQKYDLKIWAYCLMTNHVHYVCIPSNENSLSKTFNALHMRYSQYFNRKKGYLWQGRFFSCILDETHTFTAIRYIENNPVRAGIVKTPEAYQWSSARTHINRGEDAILSNDCYLEESIKDWSLVFEG
jgi:Transposase and inactivated derivatives